MGPYVTMVVAIFLMIFAMASIQGESRTCIGPLSDPRYCDQVATDAASATSSATIAASTGFCEAPATNEVITFQAPRDEATKCPNGPSGSYKSGGDFRNNFQENTTYRLVRKRVPLNKEFFTKSDGSEHSTKAADAGITTSLDPNKYELYFPQISGEIKIEGNSPYSRTRDCGERSYESQGLIYFIDYGIAFGLILENGQPIEVGGYYLTDVFKDISREDIPAEAFALCATDSSSAAATAQPKSRVVIPRQQESTDNAQLQLSYFLFDNGTLGNSSTPQYAAVNGWIDTCKPAVYLYPPEKQLVNVKVTPQGFLTYTDPLYDLKTGWTVEANPNGTLSTVNSLQPTAYPYLYYESKIYDQFIKKPTTGWVIQSSNSSQLSAFSFQPKTVQPSATRDLAESRQPMADSSWFAPLEQKFQELLPQLGLNAVQTKDFIDYWKKALPYSPYYFIGVVDPKNVDQFEPLQIIPQPDSINRVRIYFERLDTPKAVQAPQLGTSDKSLESRNSFPHNLTLETRNFHVVEWGGMVKNDPDHPFTCSQ